MTHDEAVDGGGSITYFSCHEVVAGLFQGEFPEGDVDWTRFDDVVTMTHDRPSARLRPDALWLHVPIRDGEMDDPDGVREAARAVAERVRAGRRVLVHCYAGLNRSGVVAARALMFMGFPVDGAIAAVRAARGESALCNAHFVAWLHGEAGAVSAATEGAAPYA